jgi:uncharacterized membrane protein
MPRAARRVSASASAASDLDRQPVSTRRLEAFTDGVFAIAAALLVLNLTVSDIGRVSSEQEMLAGLVSLGPSILDFTISFLLLGLLWTIHVRQFDHIERVDGFLT